MGADAIYMPAGRTDSLATGNPTTATTDATDANALDRSTTSYAPAVDSSAEVMAATTTATRSVCPC